MFLNPIVKEIYFRISFSLLDILRNVFPLILSYGRDLILFSVISFKYDLMYDTEVRLKSENSVVYCFDLLSRVYKDVINTNVLEESLVLLSSSSLSPDFHDVYSNQLVLVECSFAKRRRTFWLTNLHSTVLFLQGFFL